MVTAASGTGHGSDDRSALLDRIAIAAGAASGVAWLMWLLWQGGARTAPWALDAGPLPVVAVVAILLVRLARAPGAPDRHRAAWWLLLAASLTSALSGFVPVLRGAGVWSLSPGQLATGTAFACDGLVLGALTLLPQALRTPREARRLGLDAAMVVIASWMIAWQGVVAPALGGIHAGSFSLWRPAGDMLVCLGVATVLMRAPRGSRRLPLLLLAASQAAFVAADLIAVRQAMVDGAAPGQMPAVLDLSRWLLLLAAVAAERHRLQRAPGRDEDPSPRPVTALPYGAAAAGYALFLLYAVRDAAGPLLPLVIAATALTAVALTRQGLAIRENARLHRDRAKLAGDARFKSLVQHSADVVSIIDPGWIVTFVTPSASEMLGYRTSQLVGVSVLDIIHPEDVVDAANRLREALADRDRVMSARWRVRRSDGTYIDTDNVCTNLTADDNVRGLVLTTRDVTDRSSLEAQLVHQAFHDPLTGLANRALFEDRVQHALARRRGDLRTLGVVFVDLDRFKAVNDNLGHAFGDALLRTAAQRLVSCLRACDTAGRLGGDEFAVLVDDIQRDEDIRQVADRITAAFAVPFTLDGREASATASVGVAPALPGQGAEDLLRNADLAMYVAKSRGRGQAAVFEPAMHAAALTRRELQDNLRHALERGELSLVYQPMHALESQALVGAEALLRWRHPTRGPIPPATFIPIAEEIGLIVPIGRWVLHQACRDARVWRSHGTATAGLRVAVNLSGRQVPHGDLVDDVRAAIHSAALPPNAMVLELTESMLLRDTEQMTTVMRQLKALGVGLAIDDFGTGYSSLGNLQQLPIDILKIDRSFVDRISADEEGAVLADAIISLGRSLSLNTVAEGIENAQQAERLRSLGCDFGQGFFFSMPLSAADLIGYAERNLAFTAA